MGTRDEENQNLSRALSHKLRVQILETLAKVGQSSPKQTADILGAKLSNVSYHFRALCDYGYIEMVETRPARGAVEHFYRAKPRAQLLARPWKEIPPSLRGEVAALAVDEFLDQVVPSLEQGVFGARDGSSFALSTLTLDEQGWSELLAAQVDFEDRILLISEESEKRLETPKAGIPVLFAVALFETAGRRGR
jgi:DNA-binding transcriptional ArsR family regulator